MGSRQPNALAEGFIVASIYVAVATPVLIVAGVWQSGGWSSLFLRVNWPALIGDVLGRLTLFGLILAAVVALRNVADVRKPIGLDWRFWIALILIATMPGQPVLGWLWVALIYEYRDRKRRRAPANVAPGPGVGV